MAKMCMRMELDDDSQPTGKILDISLVEDEHYFGISQDGTELHWPGTIEDYPPHRAEFVIGETL